MSTSTNGSTTIIIPGRETQVIPGIVLTKSAVIASFAGDIDLGSMESSEVVDGNDVTITFSNRTGTKGSDIHVAGDLVINGDVSITATKIIIPGREAQTIPGASLSKQDVVSAFVGTVDLNSMECETALEDGVKVFTFSNRTGTKGQVNVLAEMMKLLQQASAGTAVVEDEEDYEDEEDDFEADEYEDDDQQLVNTRIIIPGRETVNIAGLVMDATMVKNSFSGTIDLSSYNVEEIEDGDTLEVRFTARTGTKG